MSKDIRIDSSTNDFKFENGKVVWAKEGTQVANHGHIRLQVPKGTLSLNGRLTGKEDLGLDLYGIIFRADISKSEKELEIKRVIMQTPGYVSMISFTFTQTAHSASYTAQVQTEYGAFGISDALEAL